MCARHAYARCLVCHRVIWQMVQRLQSVEIRWRENAWLKPRAMGNSWLMFGNFLPVWCYACMVLAKAPCLSTRLSQVSAVSHFLDGSSWFLAWRTWASTCLEMVCHKEICPNMAVMRACLEQLSQHVVILAPQRQMLLIINWTIVCQLSWQCSGQSATIVYHTDRRHTGLSATAVVCL